MTLLNEILTYNEKFVEEKQYEAYTTTKFPNKRMVILTCMDTRLVELLPKAMNLKNGDVKIVKNAGASVNHPFGSAMRSIFIALYELGAEEVLVIGHHDCGMSKVNSHDTIQKMKQRGISDQTLDTLRFSGIDTEKWLAGFNSVEENVKNSVEMIRNHPLMDKSVPVHGLVINPETGKLDLITEGYHS
ncbi:MAG TPA: carbonic anhydrase [Bacillus sp. (in: firmicutes)]|uniref:beta-class carbonic anhydrase n=1 Tax=Bacillus litorisediminis TaxID=2922713 RepID=UPI001FAFE0E8|nr:carbonic anhydrase [Bacillus litorisediminis]HWO74562.1 carbonic anhydrase [Bacillus sp. (in: firmicutes)]